MINLRQGHILLNIQSFADMSASADFKTELQQPDSESDIASLGHISKQSKHSVHLSKSNLIFILSALTAFVGHVVMHDPQPVHLPTSKLSNFFNKGTF